jgi:uncharacterized protein (TIGR03067 family)
MFGGRGGSQRRVTLEDVMKRCVVVLVALVSLTAGAADDGKDKAIQQELEKLKGKWKQVSVEMNGQEKPVPTQAPAVVVTIDGDKWTSEGPVGKKDSKFAIDPTQKPKAFDRIHKAKDGKGKDDVDKCIYKLEKDTLTICTARAGLLSPSSDERPKEFKTAEGGTIFVYKRVEE